MKEMKELEDAIMDRVLTTQQDKKFWKKREKTIIFLYVGAIFFVLLLLFFVKGSQAVSPNLRLTGLAEFELGGQELIIYYKMVIVSVVFSMAAFGVYFVKSKRLQNGV